MFQFRFIPHTLRFRFPAGTSRGVYRERHILLVELSSPSHPGRKGLGEIAPLTGLSLDFLPDLTAQARLLAAPLADADNLADALASETFDAFPAFRFGFETAWLHLTRGDVFFDTPFTRSEASIPINGLVWMGSFPEMMRRLTAKVDAGFRCIKIKIGAVDFDDELELLRTLRRRFSPESLTIRVDANGAFSPAEVHDRLRRIAAFGVHSIEQPLPQGRLPELAALCADPPLPIALDEELIPHTSHAAREQLLRAVRPQFIVLKPTLHGGLSGCRDWIDAAASLDIGFWLTSAMESNIGLNAIAQFAAMFPEAYTFPQGLGTGQIFTTNFPSHLTLRADRMTFSRSL